MHAPTQPTEPHFRDWLIDVGKWLLLGHDHDEPSVEPTTPPAGFPAGVTTDLVTYRDWSEYVEVPQMLVARISDAQEVADVCNWAAANGWKVRAMGRSHNWSPLAVEKGTAAGPDVVLVDTSALDGFSFNGDVQNPLATFGTGLTMEAATAHLETLDNQGASEAQGFTFPHMPAPGGLSLGGVLAIGAHGTLVPSDTGEPAGLGCLSNLVVSFEAVVTDPAAADPDTYVVKTFDRADAEAAAFLVHLGRAFLTQVTMVVVPNYYLQLHPLFPPADELFAEPDPNQPLPDLAFANLLDEYGRVEVLWFPFNPWTFVQCSKRVDTRIEPQVGGPYNYPWMYISAPENAAIRAALHQWPLLTEAFGHFEWGMAAFHLGNEELNGTARDIQIYLKDETLKVTLWGWALQLPRAEVQDASHRFFDKVQTMVNDAKADHEFPINAALEIRCTPLDEVTDLPDPAVAAPALSSSRPAAPADPAVDTMLWVNVGTMTGTPDSDAFFTELEQWILDSWAGADADRLRPEWSKAWACGAAGPWTDAGRLAEIRQLFDQANAAPQTLSWAASVLADHDRANLFTNPFLEQVLPDS